MTLAGASIFVGHSWLFLLNTSTLMFQSHHWDSQCDLISSKSSVFMSRSMTTGHLSHVVSCSGRTAML